MFRRILATGKINIISQSVKQRWKKSALDLRQMSSNAGLSIAYDNDIAVINMQKDDNRLNTEVFNTFHDYLDQVEGNPAIRGMITTGQGKFFSNGLDLEWMKTLPPDQFIDFMKSFVFFVRRVLIFPVPTLAAINGHAFAGGAILAYGQDFRVMNEEKGWICLNEVHLNKRFYGFLSAFLRAKVGSGINVTNAMVFGGRFTAQEALNSGLIHSKAPSSQLLEHSAALLKSYIGKEGLGRSALRNVKEDVYADCLKAYDENINNLGFAKQFMTDLQLQDLNDKS